MQISVATSGYGIISANNYFTVLQNAYLGAGKQFDFSASGLPEFYPTYTGKVLYELIRENLWVGGVSGWILYEQYESVSTNSSLSGNGTLSDPLGTVGANGTFTSADSKTITVSGGLIVSII